MNKREKAELRALPEKYRPMGAWSYFGYSILFSIPIVGFICALVFACNSSKINRRNYARGWFCGLLIALILIGILFAIGVALWGFNPFIDKIVEIFKEVYKF